MAMKTTREVKGVGLSIPRPDGPEKVTGQVQYVADLKPRGLLHAKLLRSPHAHARIVRIDASRARALPGVRAVLTAADIPELKRKAPTRAHAVLAIDRAIFSGQPVAAVAADELAIAEEALDLIEVVYEVLPVAIDPLRSMQPGAPPVADAGTEADTSEALAHSGVAAAKGEAEPAKAVNVAQQAHLHRGDVAKGFAESDLVLEHTYRVPMVHQGYLEAHAVLAQWDSNGLLTIWASTQGSFNTRSEVADVLGIPENRIRVIPMECGGGFGGKIRALCEPITAILARATGRPVRYVMTRREELEAGMPAPQVIIRLKTGVKRDGTLHGAGGGDHPGLRLDLGRRPDDEPGVPREPVQVAELRRPRLRGADAQAERRRLPGAHRAPDHLRHRLPHGGDRPPARARSGRVPAPAPHARGRSHGQRPAVAEQRGEGGAAPARRASAVEEPRGVGGQRRQERTRAARHGAGGRGLDPGAPAHGRHGPAQSGWVAAGPHRPGRHRRHEHRAGADRRVRLRGGHRPRSASRPGIPTARPSPGSARAARRSTRSAPR